MRETTGSAGALMALLIRRLSCSWTSSVSMSAACGSWGNKSRVTGEKHVEQNTCDQGCSSQEKTHWQKEAYSTWPGAWFRRRDTWARRKNTRSGAWPRRKDTWTTKKHTCSGAWCIRNIQTFRWWFVCVDVHLLESVFQVPTTKLMHYLGHYHFVSTRLTPTLLLDPQSVTDFPIHTQTHTQNKIHTSMKGKERYEKRFKARTSLGAHSLFL